MTTVSANLKTNNGYWRRTKFWLATRVMRWAGVVSPLDTFRDGKDGFQQTQFGEPLDAVTLSYARQWLTAHVQDGASCPCCTQFAKVYARTITSSMAYALVMIYKRPVTEGESEYFHVPDYLSRVCKLGPTTRGGDWAKLVAWGLLEEREGVRDDGSSRTGFYKITDLGKSVARGEVAVPKHALIYNGTLLRLDDTKSVTISEALGKKFDYSELMSAAPSGL
jgi:hypothetical protein